MAVLGILSLLMVPYLCGTMEMFILKDRKAGMVRTYATGFLSVFAFLLVCVLASLKLNLSFENLERIFLLGTGILTAVSLPFPVISILKGNFANTPKGHSYKCLIFLIPAVLLGAFSYFLLDPSYINDDTWEVVETTLTTGTFYKYSAMTGNVMEAGLPIFYKTYVMPMFYAIVCDFFNLDMWLVGGLIIPIIAYFLNISLVYKLSEHIFTENSQHRYYFMCVYLCVLFAGTYLPSVGIPVTAGYAVLREGYTGYGVAYGVLWPLAIEALLNRKYFRGCFNLVSVFALVRLDRVFFNFTKGLADTYTSINSAGKLVMVYIVSIVALVSVHVVKKEKIRVTLFFFPSVLIATAIAKLCNLINEKKMRIAFSLGAAVILFACCNFNPCKDSKDMISIKREEPELARIMESLNVNYPQKKLCIWSTDEIMSEIRRHHGECRVLCGRDEYVTEMAGLDFEEVSKYDRDYRKFVENKTYGMDYLVLSKPEAKIVSLGVQDGANVIILPSSCITDELSSLLVLECGFTKADCLEGKYTAFVYGVD